MEAAIAGPGQPTHTNRRIYGAARQSSIRLAGAKSDRFKDSNHFLAARDAAKNDGQHRNSSRLLLPREIASFVITPDDRPGAVARS
jgi:hypothetical protein